MSQVLYTMFITCLVLITLRFTCGEKKIWYIIKRSQNIISIIVLPPEIFPDLEMTRFWSIDYKCQVSKLEPLFWSCPKFWTRFILIRCYLYLLLNIFCHRSTTIVFGAVLFGTFSKLWKLFFEENIYVVFYPKTSNFYNSGMVNCRKLPDHLMNNIFNVLSFGLQYTVSFKWPDFVLWCLVTIMPKGQPLKLG